MHRTNARTDTPRKGEAGFAFVVALFVSAALSLAVAGALLAGMSHVRATRNYRGAAQVHFVAESGVSEALQRVNAVGVVNFQNEIVAGWSRFLGNGVRSFPALGGFSYSVSPVADVANPAAVGRLVATATGPEGVRKTVVANVSRSNIPATTPGAIYLANDARTDATFNGNAFLVDGNDHNFRGGAGPAPAIPGIATRNDANTQETLASLGDQQKDNILGTNYSAGPPLVPSVVTSPAAPSIAQINQIIDDLLALGGVVTVTDAILGNAAYGTPDAPQITHVTSPSGTTIRGGGSVSGAGILIVEGDLTIQGTLDFIGLVLVRGRTNVVRDPSLTRVTGNATVYGSIWTQDINLVVGGSSIVYYSSQALGLANLAGGPGSGVLPAPLVVNSLADCGQLPSGTGGCP